MAPLEKEGSLDVRSASVCASLHHIVCAYASLATVYLLSVSLVASCLAGCVLCCLSSLAYLVLSISSSLSLFLSVWRSVEHPSTNWCCVRFLVEWSFPNDEQEFCREYFAIACLSSSQLITTGPRQS